MVEKAPQLFGDKKGKPAGKGPKKPSQPAAPAAQPPNPVAPTPNVGAASPPPPPPPATVRQPRRSSPPATVATRPAAPVAPVNPMPPVTALAPTPAPAPGIVRPTIQPQQGSTAISGAEEWTNEVEIGGYNIDLRQDLSVDPNDLEAAFQRHPAKYGWWLQLREKAQTVEERIKVEMDILEAELDISTRQQLQSEGTKFTEAVVRSRIILSPSHREKKDLLLLAQKERRILDAAVRAMESRTRMLESLGYHLRAELAAYRSDMRTAAGDAAGRNQ